MGRKKRKSTDTDDGGPESISETNTLLRTLPPPDLNLPPPPLSSTVTTSTPEPRAAALIVADEKEEKKAASSGYAMTTHSGEIIDEDIYVSEGSDSEDEGGDVEMLLVGSRMGVMRRGIHHPLLVQPNRQWVRHDEKGDGGQDDEQAAELKRRQEEEELAKLDPAQRAARLLAEKQRKLEEAKETARRMESEENAGRDPCLFSKRTAFDIRFDNLTIEEKPWARGAADLSDFFNYGLTEEDWIDYAQQQLMIRQELTDASRQRRPPDPAIVPVTPRAPNKQNPKVAVAVSNGSEDKDSDNQASIDDEMEPVVGPVLVKIEEEAAPMKVKAGEGPAKAEKIVDVYVGAGGAWGAGAAPGSVLARLIEEQEKKQEGSVTDMEGAAPESRSHDNEASSNYDVGSNADANQEKWNQDLNAPQEWDNQSRQSNQDWDNHSRQSGQDWSAHGQQFQQDWSNQGHPGNSSAYRCGGRGFNQPYGGRGGRGGRGFNNMGGRGRGRSFPPQQQWMGGRGDFQQRKRPREDQSDPRWRR